MAAHIFILGVSGYVGGQLKDILSKHPDYKITGLVRSEEQGRKVTSEYPLVQIAYGDLDSNDVLVEQAKKADVVLQAASSDHNPSVTALIHGMSLSGKKGTFIQLSGAASYSDASGGYGQPLMKVWDDVADLQEILSLDHSRGHVDTDQLVLEEEKKAGIRTAIVVPAMVYGAGEGPIKTKSIQLPWMVDAIAKRGKGFMVGEGKNYCSAIHVKDLVDVLIFLTEKGLDPSGGGVSWGSEGIYHAETGSCTMGMVAEAIAKHMKDKGIIATPGIDHLSAEDARKIHPWGPQIWKANIRIRGSRLPALGWTPINSHVHVVDTIPELLE